MTTLFERIKAKLRPKAKQPCPLAKGTLAVVLTRSDTGESVRGAAVTVTGPTPGGGTTDDLGATIFTERDPGAYRASVVPPPLMNRFRWYQQTPDGSVSPDGIEILIWKIAPPPTLRVKVVWERPSGQHVVREVLSGVRVKAKGPLEYSGSTAQDGTITFRDIQEGSYRVTCESLGAHAEKYTIPNPMGESLALAETKEVILVAIPLVSLRIVLFDKKERPIG